MEPLVTAIRGGKRADMDEPEGIYDCRGRSYRKEKGSMIVEEDLTGNQKDPSYVTQRWRALMWLMGRILCLR